jgi:heme/copper-type cytochrome/quinol oxidase subunit 3
VSAYGIGAAARGGRERPLGWWGAAMLVATEATLLAVMTATYFYLRFKNLAWPPRGVPVPTLVVPLLVLGLLLAATTPVCLGVRAGRARRRAATCGWLIVALVLQAAYLALQLHQYAHDLRRFAPSGSAYGSIYYTLLGAADAHVAVGLLLTLWLLAKLARGITRYRLNALEAISFYWYAVNALTVVVTLTVLSPAL